VGLTTFPKHLFLIGPRGSGKSAVGAQLSKLLEMDFLDADPYLETKFQRKIPDIFQFEGETKFREIESSILKEITNLPPKVVATGGGVILAESNRDLLKRNGFCVWLKTSENLLLERLWTDQNRGVNRPALTNQNEPGSKDSLKAEIKTILEKRGPLYEITANLVIETDGKKPHELAEMIAAHIDRKRLAP
jgi:shikimate kinase